MINSFVVPEGQKRVIYALGISVLLFLFICDFLGWIALIITFALLFIYRNSSKPSVNVTDMVSPVTGRVSAIDNLDGQKVIYVDVTLCNNHILRAPSNGTFSILEDKKGLNLSSDSFRALKLNSQIVLAFEKITLSLLSGKCNLGTLIIEETELSQGEHLGIFTHGKAKITLDKTLESKVQIGQKLEAGITPLA